MTQAMAAVAGVTFTAAAVLGVVVALVVVQDWRRFRPDTDPATEALITAAYAWHDTPSGDMETRRALLDAVQAHREAHDG